MGAISYSDYKKMLKDKKNELPSANGTVNQNTVPNTISFDEYQSRYNPNILSNNSILLPTQNEKKNKSTKPNFGDSIGYTAKSFGTGILGGITNIGKATLQEATNNLNKGEKENKGLVKI